MEYTGSFIFPKNVYTEQSEILLKEGIKNLTEQAIQLNATEVNF